MGGRSISCFARISSCVLLLALAPAQSVHAQEAFAAGIAENVASGTSPTDFTSRVRIRTGYFGLDEGAWLLSTRLSGTYAPRPDVALRLQVPVLYLDPDGRDSEFGISDISTRVLVRVWNRRRVATFAGLELFFPTASDPILGTEQYSVAALAAAVVQLAERVFFVPVYQQFISYAGDDDRAEFNILRFRPMLIATWEHRIYTLLDPGFYWDLEDELPLKDTMTVGVEVGKRVGRRMTFSGKPSIKVYGTEDFEWAFELGATYRFD